MYNKHTVTRGALQVMKKEPMWKNTNHSELLGYKLESSGVWPTVTWTVVFEYPKFFIRYNGDHVVQVAK